MTRTLLRLSLVAGVALLNACASGSAPAGKAAPAAPVVFETAFAQGYIVTDFIYDQTRSFYVLAHGESTLMTK